MSKVATIQCEYTQTLEFDISDDNINYDDIEHHWCKWGTLHIEMKDGTSHEYSNGHDMEVDWKWPDKLRAYDKDFEDLTEDQDGNG
jgi:hypothetical protein